MISCIWHLCTGRRI